MRRLFSGFCCLLLFLILAGCQVPAQPPQEGPETLQVATTIYPVTFFTREIAGDRARVEPLLPEGADAHHWEPTAQTMSTLEQSDLLIINGADMELWLDDLLGALDKEVSVVDTTEDLDLLSWDEESWLEEGDNVPVEGQEGEPDSPCDHEHSQEQEHDNNHNHEYDDYHDHDHSCSHDHQHGDIGRQCHSLLRAYCLYRNSCPPYGKACF